MHLVVPAVHPEEEEVPPCPAQAMMIMVKTPEEVPHEGVVLHVERAVHPEAVEVQAAQVAQVDLADRVEEELRVEGQEGQEGQEGLVEVEHPEEVGQGDQEDQVLELEVPHEELVAQVAVAQVDPVVQVVLVQAVVGLVGQEEVVLPQLLLLRRLPNLVVKRFMITLRSYLMSSHSSLAM